MKKALVNVHYGRGCNNGIKAAYRNAKAKKCKGCVIPIWPKNRLAIVYYCNDCNMVKKQSKKTKRTD